MFWCYKLKSILCQFFFICLIKLEYKKFNLLYVYIFKIYMFDVFKLKIYGLVI